jgi:hypothetical protein
MRTLLAGFSGACWKFLFRHVAEAVFATAGNMSIRPQQGLVNHAGGRVLALRKHVGAPMTSISAASSSSTTLTPLQKLQQELQAELAKGTVATGDSDALSSALAEIDKSLQGDSASQSGSTQSKPGDIKSKIDDLIEAQVSSGKLTTEQATELQGVFQAAFAGGPGGAGGPPPGPPPSDSASTDATTSADSTSTDTDTALQKLLAALQESLAASSASSYSATGSSASTTNKASFSALLVDYTS